MSFQCDKCHKDLQEDTDLFYAWCEVSGDLYEPGRNPESEYSGRTHTVCDDCWEKLLDHFDSFFKE